MTLVELLVTVAVAAILLGLTAPSFNDFIKTQRLRGVNAQLVTDLQYARSEAAARSLRVRFRYGQNDEQTCYTIFIGAAAACKCERSPVCDAGVAELRTVSVAASTGVKLSLPENQAAGFEYDPATGRIYIDASDDEGDIAYVFGINARVGTETERSLRTTLTLAGRPSVCTPVGSRMGGVAC